MATPTPEPVIDAKALLGAANGASEKVAALHIAFLAVCTYLVVIVFSTTDMDLLIGKGIKLPVVAVDVPIVGFYAAAPYLLVLIHFNLLLELQLLSRKLYAFDDAARQQEGIGGLRDQLNIFPYNYYLVGQPSQLVALFVALLVTITILLLPLAALLTLQARFLAYQSEAVTWAQRIATWLYVGLVAVLWPVIMDRGDSWSAFTKRVWDNVKQRRLRWAWRFAGIALAVTWLASTFPHQVWPSQVWPSLALAAWLLLTVSAPAWRRAFHWISRGRYFAGSKVTALVPGATGLLVVLLLGLPLPLFFLVEGETLDSPNAVGTQILYELGLRHLDLWGEVLLAKPARPETIADLRSTDFATRVAAQRSIEPVNLRGRGLRRANLRSALMPMADLSNAQLQGANLYQAQLQGAVLYEARLQGADLSGAQLQGADLGRAWLQGAVLERAQLQGADLRNASLYINSMPPAIELVDVRGLKWRPLGAKEVEGLKKMGDNNTWTFERRDRYLELLDGATTAGLKSPMIESCLQDENTKITCKKTFDVGEFRERVFKELEALACQSSYIAHGIVARLGRDRRSNDDSATKGLALRLQDFRKKGVTKESCPGLFSLAEEDAALLTKLTQPEKR